MPSPPVAGCRPASTSALPLEVIERLLPDVLVKGADWSLDAIVGRETVEAAGGRVERADDGANGGMALSYGKPGFENPPFIARGLPA